MATSSLEKALKQLDDAASNLDKGTSGESMSGSWRRQASLLVTSLRSALTSTDLYDLVGHARDLETALRIRATPEKAPSGPQAPAGHTVVGDPYPAPPGAPSGHDGPGNGLFVGHPAAPFPLPPEELAELAQSSKTSDKLRLEERQV